MPGLFQKLDKLVTKAGTKAAAKQYSGLGAMRQKLDAEVAARRAAASQMKINRPPTSGKFMKVAADKAMPALESMVK